ncbi:MAG: hypothetical protein AAGA55_01035 [Planctomycetota bacterium]
MPSRLSRLFPLAAAVAIGGCLTACSVRPRYMVRVENDSSGTVVAQIVRDVAFEDDEVLAHERLRPDDRVTLGPVQADPFDEVELFVSRPGDLQTLPEKFRISRGSWVATVEDASVSTWSRFSVRIRASDEPIPGPDETPDASDGGAD